MKPDDANSAASSVATSPSGPGRVATDPLATPTNSPRASNSASGARPDDKLSEAEFLKRQAEDAKAALAAAFAEMKAKLGEGANPFEWAREYPKMSLGLAAVAGFVGTTLVVPSREEQALAKLAAIEKALNPGKTTETNHAGNEKPGTSHQPLLTVIIREVLAIVRPLVLSLLTAGIAGRQVNPADAQAAAANDPAKEPVAS